MKNILEWFNYNRFTIVVPVLMLVIWIASFGCIPTTISPMSNVKVTVDALQIEYDTMISKFDLAATDLERKYEQQKVLTQMIVSLASGQVTNWGALGNMVIAGGGLGLLFDNRRKNTVIAAMKKGKTVT